MKQYTVGRRLNVDEDGAPKKRKRRTELEATLDGSQDISAPQHGLVSEIDNKDASVMSENESESEGYSDDEGDLMDDMIVGNVGPSDKNALQDTVAESMNELVDKIIAKEYVEEIPDTYLEPVSELLSSNITKWCRNPPKRDEVKNLFKDCMCPRNIEGLQQVTINEALYKYLPKHSKIADQKLRGINAFIARALGPVVQVFEQLCKIEITSGECVNDKTFDASLLRKSLGKSIKLSCAAHAIILQRRKSNLEKPTG